MLNVDSPERSTEDHFGIDVAFGDPIVGEPDLFVAEDLLDFAGIAPPTVRLYPVVSHIAEKLHAFTMPRPRPNSRVRDLPDLALLAMTGPIEGKLLWKAIGTTFDFRATHAVPKLMPAPPSFWAAPYAAMASRNELPWASLREVTNAVSFFLDPILKGEGRLWRPAEWSW